MGVGTGHGKLLLFGEHAAVYGHPALGIQLEATLSLSFIEGPQWSFEGIPNDAVSIVREVADETHAILGLEAGRGTIRLSGSLPTAVGFGSSAALCIALLRALDSTHRLTGDADRLWEASHRLEHRFHGTPSGIDTGLALYPGASTIYPDPPNLPRREPARLPSMKLLVGALPRISSTAALVRGIRERRDADREKVDAQLNDLGRCAREASTATTALEMGDLARQAQRTLTELGLSTPLLESALLAAESAGALGGKLSGAGGGGAFWSVFPADADTSEAEERVHKKTAGEIVFLRPMVVA